jgi:hypothetical protein
VQSEPWLPRDNAMIDQLKSIGIEKGQPFSPTSQMKGMLSAAARLAHATLEAKYDIGLPPFFGEESHWTYPMLPDFLKAVKAAEPDEYPIDARGLTFSYGHAGLRNLGGGQFPLIAIKDKDGSSLGGGTTYRLTVPPNVPVEQYWSVTAYDRETHALIRNMDRVSRSSRDANLQKGNNGTVDIYFGPAAPKGKESNWIPTDPQHDFELVFRFYTPKKELFDKVWSVQDAERFMMTVGSGGSH